MTERALLAVALSLTLATAAACNAIVGVEDVKLRRPTQPDTTEEEEPEPIDDGGEDEASTAPRVVQAALGEQHSCARISTGHVKCWGDDTRGQTGSGGPADGGVVSTPREVLGLDDAVDLASGRNHSCVARRSGKVTCWGYNLDGQLGNGESGNQKATPVDVLGLDDAVTVAAGGNFSCAARRGGSIACWGGNGSGQLGTGDEAPTTSPVAVVGVSGAIMVAAGQAHACALKSDGTVACWGEGRNGQLGSGSATNRSKAAAVTSVTDAVSIAAAERSTCASTKSGAVLCWGANDVGQLGNGATSASPNPTPVSVASLSDATSLSAGRSHVCAVRRSGKIACWGASAVGQLGDGRVRPDGDGSRPADVTDVAAASSVAAGGDHACATTSAKALVCWGANDRGELGNGQTTGEPSPVSVRNVP